MTSGEATTKRIVIGDRDGPRQATVLAPTAPEPQAPVPKIDVPGLVLKQRSRLAQRGIWEEPAGPPVREQLHSAGMVVAPAYATAQDKVRVEMRKAARQAGLARLYKTAWGELPSE